MNEDKLKALLEQDKNLRDAIRMEEAEGPQMPPFCEGEEQEEVVALDCSSLRGWLHDGVSDPTKGYDDGNRHESGSSRKGGTQAGKASTGRSTGNHPARSACKGNA